MKLSRGYLHKTAFSFETDTYHAIAAAALSECEFIQDESALPRKLRIDCSTINEVGCLNAIVRVSVLILLANRRTAEAGMVKSIS